MDVDPSVNTIVFEVEDAGNKEMLVEQSPTRANDGIRTAWQALQNKTGVRPAQVGRIYSEWEPSAEDDAFLSHTFPNVEVSYSFSRPMDDGWEEAFLEVARIMRASLEEEDGTHGEKQDVDASSILLPVLRTYVANDGFAASIVHRPIGADLAVFLAHVGMTSRGTVGIDYLMRNAVGTSEKAIHDSFELALQNLRSGMRVGVSETGGIKIFTFSHPSNMSASALCLPDFYNQARSWFGADEVFVAFTDPANLFVTLPDTPVADQLARMVEESEYWGAVALTPACYLLNRNGLRQVAIRTTG